jgi:hypothetical protein
VFYVENKAPSHGYKKQIWREKIIVMNIIYGFLGNVSDLVMSPAPARILSRGK